MSLPRTTYDDDISEIFISSHEISASKNQFQNRSDFSQGIDSVELMSGVLKSFFFNSGSERNACELTVLKCFAALFKLKVLSSEKNGAHPFHLQQLM